MEAEMTPFTNLSVTRLGNLHFPLYNSRFCEFKGLNIQKENDSVRKTQ